MTCHSREEARTGPDVILATLAELFVGRLDRSWKRTHRRSAKHRYRAPIGLAVFRDGSLVA